MKKYHIILVSHRFPPGSKAGIANHVCQLASNLSMLKIKCTVLAQNSRGKQIKDPSGIKVYRSPIEAPLFLKDFGGRFFVPLEKLFFSAFCVIKSVTEFKYKQNILFHGHHSTHGGKQAVFIGRVLNKPSVVTIHGVELDNIKETKPTKQFKTLMNASAIICQKNIAREKLIEWGYPHNRIHKIIGPIKKEFIDLGESYNVSTLVPTILFCGRFQPIKRPHLLIEAVSLLKKMDQNIHAVFLGDGPILDDMKELAKNLDVADRVEFKGWVTDITPFLSSAAIFTALSDKHNSSDLSLLEAMAVGVPIISTKSPGIEEIIRHENNGLLCNGTPEDLAQAIVYMFNHPELAAQISKNCRQTAIDKAGPKAFLANHLKVYNEITTSL
jgi:glycosyltransferase involved in cell wall biosynthesis